MAININNIHTLNTSLGKNSSLRGEAQAADKADKNRYREQNTAAQSPDQKSADSLTLTDSVMNLKKLEDSIAQLPIMDIQKVERIQNQIKDGSYQIDAEKIADRIIEMERALFS